MYVSSLPFPVAGKLSRSEILAVSRGEVSLEEALASTSPTAPQPSCYDVRMPNDDAFLDGLGTDAIVEEVLRTVRKESASDSEAIDQLYRLVWASAALGFSIYSTLPPAAKAEVIRRLDALPDRPLTGGGKQRPLGRIRESLVEALKKRA